MELLISMFRGQQLGHTLWRPATLCDHNPRHSIQGCHFQRNKLPDFSRRFSESQI